MLEYLYKEHSTALRAFLWMRMGPSEDYDDLVQEVFFREEVGDFYNQHFVHYGNYV